MPRQKQEPKQPKKLPKALAPLIVVAVIVFLGVLYAFLPPTVYFRVSAQTDDGGLPMLQSPDGALYRQYPVSQWQPGGPTDYLGVGGKYYLHSYENDPGQIFLHGIEYVWVDSTVEYYRDGFVFPAVAPQNVGSMVALTYQQSDYNEAMGKSSDDSVHYSRPVRDPMLFAEIFALLDDAALYTEIPQDGWFNLGLLEFSCKQYPSLQYDVPVIRVDGSPYFVVYETDADTGVQTPYGVPVPPELARALLEEVSETPAA